MIRLAYWTLDKKTIIVEVDNLIIKVKNPSINIEYQAMPLDMNQVTKFLRSGKESLILQAKKMIATNRGQSFEDYKKCKTDEEVIEFIRKDIKKTGEFFGMEINYEKK